MKIFSYLYEWCIKLSKHKRAPLFLVINSFIESIFWPIPPDVMLAPMCLANPNRAYYFAFLAVASSVAGAVIGYYLGYFIYDPYIADLIKFLNYESAMITVREWFTLKYGILMVFIGAFTPVPYKVIAITTGLVAAESMAHTGSVGQLSILYFILVSIVGRGLRFYLEAIIIKVGGAKMERTLRRYIDIIGWICVLLVMLYILYEVIWN